MAKEDEERSDKTGVAVLHGVLRNCRCRTLVFRRSPSVLSDGASSIVGRHPGQRHGAGDLCVPNLRRAGASIARFLDDRGCIVRIQAWVPDRPVLVSAEPW